VISQRRAALLGLDAPLSPIMAAVLGLWPAEEEQELPAFYPTGPAKRAPPKRRVSRLEVMQPAREMQDLREAQEVIAALFALEGVF
jgi:hypothetical protein